MTAVLLAASSQASAQTATVTLTSQKQYIRGFGGINHAAWAGDLTAAERTLAFGNAAGQLGFSVLRIPVTDGNPDSVNVATAKAAIANGAIVFATPWNAAHTYTSADFPAYATHLSNFVSYMKNQGVNLYAISVQNEPDYGAQAGWGSWTAAACHDFTVTYGASLGTKLMSCESFSYNKSYYDPILNDSAALANTGVFGTHLYGTALAAYAYPLFDQKAAGKERWMTEHYTDSTTDANSWPNALGVASELHNAMVTAQFNAYIWWYIKRSYGPINSGAVTKRGYCMAHWSKFVRPGFYRVDATASPATGLSLSAYKGDSSLVIVVVNTNTAAKSLDISIPGSALTSFTKYTTSSSKSLASEGTVSTTNGSLSVSLDASSVTTFVAAGTTGTGGTGGTGGGGAGTGGAAGASGSAGANSGGQTGVGGSTAAGSGGVLEGSGGASGGGLSAAGTAGTLASVGGSSSSGGADVGHSGASGVSGSTGVVSAAGSESSGNSGSGATNADASSDQAGCSCRLGRREVPAHSLALLSLLSVFAIRARRRRR